MYDVAIIGAGPAGMTAAITASNNGKRVVLVDRNPQLGRKLLATGNGRCNLANQCVAVDRYHGSTPEFINAVLSRFDLRNTLDFFQGLGLVVKVEPDGRMFPRTNQASSVVEVMRHRLVRNKVRILLDAQVTAIEKPSSWRITLSSGRKLHSANLILATGGRAAHYLGSTGDGLYWATKLGHGLTPIHAALVPVEVVEDWTRDAQGIKVEAGVRTTSDDTEICQSFGDVLFTSWGVSGPAIMAQSRSIAPLLHTSGAHIHIDLFPDLPEDSLDRLILDIFASDYRKTLSGSLVGLLPAGLIPVVIRLAEASGAERVSDISKSKRLRLVKTLKDLTLTVSKLRPLREAQVTAGGIRSEEIDPSTLQSRLVDSLFFAGEILDVDGDSGGFNLQWAWSSGYVGGHLGEIAANASDTSPRSCG